MRRLYPLIVTAGLVIGTLVPASLTFAASANAAARRQMNMVLPEVKLSGVALADALEFLRDVSGMNLNVNWKALEQAGVTREVPVNVRLRSVSLRKALTMVLAEAGGGDVLTFDIDGGVVEVTTRELADARMITKVYPIEDLLMVIPDFNDAPSFDLTSLSNQSQNQSGGVGGGAGGVGGATSGSGSSQGLFGGSGSSQTNNRNSNTGPTKTERAQEIIDLIRAVIQPEVWQENGGKAAIRYWSGNLIITAPRNVHEAIGGPVD